MDTPPTTPPATRLAAPFSPPPEFKPPPEPSLWPLLLLGLFGLTCLGGSAGLLILGISRLQGSLTATSTKELATAKPADNPPLQQPLPLPRPQQKIGDHPPAPPQADAQPPDPLEVRKIQDEIRQAMRRMEEQFAREVRPALPPPGFPPGAPGFPPGAPGLTPFAALAQPELELPPLAFDPEDVEPLGRELQGDHRFRDLAPPGGWLVGLRVTKGRPWNGSIMAIQPIYQVGGEYQLGERCGSGRQATEHVQLLAKPGYAAGKIEARLGLIMNAVRIDFYRVQGEFLDPADSYSTDWVGALGGSPHTFDGAGHPLVGLAASYQPRSEVIAIQVLRTGP